MIPTNFSPVTEYHEEIINFNLPPAAQKIYSWLTRRCKPGVVQEFDKEDFDRYCLKMGRKPFSVQWFVSAFKKLVATRLIKVIRKYRGYGYKIEAYHPWQLDSWLSENTCNKTCNKPHKNFNNLHKKFKTMTSNIDAVVPSYRESREKQSNETRNAAAMIKTTLEKTATPSPKQEEITIQGSQPSSNRFSSVGLSDSPSSQPTINQQEKTRHTEEKINIKNPQWSAHLTELDNLGVRENKTIIALVQKYDSERVASAIALFKEKKRKDFIENRNGYFVKLLQENWASSTESYEPINTSELFSYWYGLARELGYCSSTEEREGEHWVCLSGTWERFTDAIARGYSLEYLRKVKNRNR